MADTATNLVDLLDELADTSRKTDQISIVDIQDKVAHQPFEPFLAAVGTIF